MSQLAIPPLSIYPALGGLHDFGSFRLLGPGLGNMLFPWARAELLARSWDVPMIFPAWPQVKIGTLFRREADKRTYRNLFNNPGTYIGGKRKSYLLMMGKRINEVSPGSERPIPQRRPLVIWIEGTGDMFSDLKDETDFLIQRFSGLLDPQLLLAIPNLSGSAGVHVRLGDFKPVDEARLRAGSRNARVPLDWFADRILYLKALGFRRILLFSDGSDNEIAPLLNIGGTCRAKFGSSVADLIAMSRLDLLVMSNSTLGYWAAYLGRVPTLHYPGQLDSSFAEAHLVSRETDYGESVL